MADRAGDLDALAHALAVAADPAPCGLREADLVQERKRGRCRIYRLNPKPLAALERRVLREIVELSGWRMQEAADRLGISRVTLWRKMKDALRCLLRCGLVR